MKLIFPASPLWNRRLRERGSATVLVLALVGVLVIYVNNNQATLGALKRDLRHVEQQQLKKFQAPPKPTPAVKPLSPAKPAP